MATVGADPFTFPRMFRTVQIAGVESPGVAVVTGAERAYGWDEKKGKGADGATTTYTGKDLAKPKVLLKLWTAEHILAWDAYRELLQSSIQGDKVTALEVFHPALDHNDISSCTIAKIGGLEHQGGGLYHVTIELQEYRQPKAAGGTPQGSKAGAPIGVGGEIDGPGGTVTASDQMEEEIGVLYGEAFPP